MISDIGGTWTCVAGLLALFLMPIFRIKFWSSMSIYFLKKEIDEKR
jgi:hypothetical protein